MDVTGVVKALDAARVKTRKTAEREIKEVKARRDSDLLQLDLAERALAGGNESSGEDSKSAESMKSKRSRPTRERSRVHRKRLSPASAEDLADRCEKVTRVVEENREPVALGEIARALGLTGHKAKRALQTLKGDGRIKSIGTGSATRYALADPGTGRLSKQPPTQGVLEERIVAVLGDRHQATVEELAQALRKPTNVVAEACGKLQGEERISMSRFSGRPVYVLAVRV
jgi:DNA-binding Lrp family transcriptional regulator